MNENKLIRSGKISQFNTQIFRYTVILILLAIAGVGTAGIAGVLGVMYFKFVQKIIPFNISIHKDFLALLKQNVEIKFLRKQFKKKLIYNIIIFGTLLSIALIILFEVSNSADQIFFSILFGTFIFISLYQLYCFKLINDFINLISSNHNSKSSIVHTS